MNELLNIKNISKRFVGVKALDNFSCTVNNKEILGLIGPNGAGKSTLFNIITGFIPCDEGIAYFRGENIIGKPPDKIASLGISRTFQMLRLIRQMTVLENVMLCFKNQAGENLKNVFFKRKELGKMEKENKDKAMSLLEFAGIAKEADDLARNLSYGQQKLLSIVCCLSFDADLLLLDEPVAGINPLTIGKIISIITELPKKGKSIILIEHNIDVIMQMCDRIIFMDEGAKISEGPPEYVLNDPRIIKAYLD